MSLLFEFTESLKRRLAESKASYVRESVITVWLSDVTSDSRVVEEIDFDKLLKEIDEFSAEFRRKKE